MSSAALIDMVYLASESAPIRDRRRVTWAELVELVTTHQPGPKDGAPAWMPCDVEPGRRKTAKLRAVTVLVLDVEAQTETGPDGIKRAVGPFPPSVAEMAERLRALGLDAFVVTTWSHHAPVADGETLGPRYRIGIRLSRPIAGADLVPLGERVARLLGIERVIDRNALRPKGIYFLPRAPHWRMAIAERAVVDGGALDVDAVLAEQMVEQPAEPSQQPAALPLLVASEADLADARAALDELDPDCGYHQWLRVGMALHALQWVQGFDLWAEWSSKGRKWADEGAERLRSRWAGFDARGDIRPQTLYWMGNEARRAREKAQGAREQDEQAERRKPAAASSSPKAKPAVRLVPASSLTPELIQWLWPDWLARNKVHLLMGPPGCGKTMLAVGMAAILSRGARWPDGLAAPRSRTIVWTGEDGIQDTLLPRYLAAGGDPAQLLFVGDADGAPFDPATHMAALAEAAEGVDDVGLVILDPVSSAVAGDSHKNAEVRRGLQPVVEMAERLGAAVLGITHCAKNARGRDPVERALGSIAFSAVCRVLFLAAPRPEERGGGFVFLKAKSNIGSDKGGFVYETAEAQVPNAAFSARRIVFGDRIDGHARDVLGDIEMPDDIRAEADDAEAWLVDQLRDGPRPSTEIQAAAKGAGITSATLRRAKCRAGVIAEKSAFSAGWRWRLDDHHPASPMQDRRAQDAHAKP